MSTTLTTDQETTLNQLTPIFSAIQKSTLTLLGGFMRRNADHLLADQIKIATRALVSDQRIQNRLTQSAVRIAQATRGSDDAPMDHIMQLAIEGEKYVSRIKRSGQIQMSVIRNAGDQAAYKAAAQTFGILGSGIGEALSRGLFAEDTGSSTPGSAPRSGPSILVAPGVAIGGRAEPAVVAI